MKQVKKGMKVNYCGKIAEVLETNSTHCLIQFDSGTKIATPKSSFKEEEIYDKD